MNCEKLAGAVAAAALAFTAACADGGSAGSADVAALAARVQRLEDDAAIRKVQAKYAHYLFTQRYDRIFAETFAQNRDDV
ncbi:MAG: hypothetical protein JXB36_09785, partial [Gammaproteobacteria bacterium]|nr:hypothetical protein [Gammaproteobacteria bacterium]